MQNIIAFIQQMNIYYLSTFVVGVAFLYSVIKDRRRFRNAILLQAFIILLFVTCLSLQDVIPGMAGIFVVFFMMLSIFLVFIVPFLLIANGFVMIRKEGFRITNLLAFFFAILILLGEFAVIRYSVTAMDHDLFDTLLSVLFGYSVIYVSMVFLAFMFYSLFMYIIPRGADYDYVIVLGAGLLNGNQVSRLLGSRIDKGIKVYKKAYTSCKLIMSGGQGGDELCSEAEAMKQYAIEQGVDPSDILLEDESMNTMQNLLNSKKMIQKRGGRQRVAVVTSSYHVLRACFIAIRINFEITGIGSKIAFYYWPTAMTREYAGLIKHYWKIYFFFYFAFALFLTYLVFISFS